MHCISKNRYNPANSEMEKPQPEPKKKKVYMMRNITDPEALKTMMLEEMRKQDRIRREEAAEKKKQEERSGERIHYRSSLKDQL
jgi:hypothetical protein